MRIKTAVFCIALVFAALVLSACGAEAMPAPTPAPSPTPTRTPSPTPSPSPSAEPYLSPYAVPSDDGMVILEFPAQIARIMDNTVTPPYEETGEIRKKKDGSIRLEMTRENYDAFVAVLMDRLWMNYDMCIFRYSFIEKIAIKDFNFDAFTMSIDIENFSVDDLDRFFWDIIPATWIYQLYAQIEPEVEMQLIDARNDNFIEDYTERLYDYFGLEEP